jgi:AraC family transcriptional regulator
VRFGLLLHEICLLALDKLPARGLAAAADRDLCLVESARAWFSEHLAEAPGLRAVADSVNCSPSHLRRLFVKVAGKPPHQALEELRLERARELLLEGGYSLKEIAGAGGYESQGCFSRAFKSALGSPPRAWRDEQAPPLVDPGS